jgi:hypothetical protein
MEDHSGDGRLLVLCGACLFVVSTIFPIAASLLREEQVGRPMGLADVAIAAALLVWAGLLSRRRPRRDSPGLAGTAATFHQGLWNLPLVLLVVFLVAGDRVRWNILLPGLAWRVWLLANVFPIALAVWRAGEPSDQNPSGRRT